MRKDLDWKHSVESDSDCDCASGLQEVGMTFSCQDRDVEDDDKDFGDPVRQEGADTVGHEVEDRPSPVGLHHLREERGSA